jgi:hypothetical protein
MRNLIILIVLTLNTLPTFALEVRDAYAKELPWISSTDELNEVLAASIPSTAHSCIAWAENVSEMLLISDVFNSRYWKMAPNEYGSKVFLNCDGKGLPVLYVSKQIGSSRRDSIIRLNIILSSMKGLGFAVTPRDEESLLFVK